MNLIKYSLQARLIIALIFIGSAPLVISNGISYFTTSDELEKQGIERARLVTINKVDAISDYFLAETNSIVDLASSALTIQALEEFSKPFEVEKESNEWAKEYVPGVKQFYETQFAPTYYEKSQVNIKINSIVDKLDGLSLAAQFDFIVANENPVGKKDLLMTPKRSSPYGQSHIKFHPYFRDYLTRHALYDLFLVNDKGRVVYTVYKETDFATSLTEGPWAGTGLAKAFEASVKMKTGDVHVEDFSRYAPSYEAPASFASTPIFKNGNYVGSLMIQLPLDKISAIANGREGLGKMGEVLLLGSDLKLRADTFRNKQTHTVATSFAIDSKISVESAATQKAYAGQTGFMRNMSYDGHKTFAYFQPIKIRNLTWYVITELSQDEVFAGLRKIAYFTWAVLTLGFAAVIIVSLVFGKSISNRLRSIVQMLEMTGSAVSSASVQSASSASQLSEASTEQASSLQETMASAEEISAMVNQNVDSTKKAMDLVHLNQKASEEGSMSVGELIGAINEIKDSNDEILNQMESSNKEFSEIVKIISEISSKTTVINDIVFQTKLLSFNASVEAARAGEHGKGFAVVAEEVGNLAQMSGNAAEEISSLLSQSTKKVNEIVEATHSRVERLVEIGKDKVTLGRSKAAKCNEALQKIAENARLISSMTVEIANASKEQAQGISEINKAISQLDQVTHQNSKIAQTSSMEAESLKAESCSLNNVVIDLVKFIEGSKAADTGRVDASEFDQKAKSVLIGSMDHWSKDYSDSPLKKSS